MLTVARRSRFSLPIAAAVLLVAVFVPTTSAGADTTFVVDVVADDGSLSACTLAPGDCSLRGAVAAANANAGADTIDFLIPAMQCPGGICRITVTNGPLEITEAVTIDATTQPQNGGPQANVCATSTEPSYMRVEVVTDPSATDANAFVVNHAVGSSTIRGLALGTDYSGGVSVGIYSLAGSGHHIACNHLGVDAAGTGVLGSASFIALVGFENPAADVVVGTDGDGVDDLAERNVLASLGYGVYINANNGIRVSGNYFGYTADGTTALSSGSVYLRQLSSNNLIGTDNDGISDDLEVNYFGHGTSVDMYPATYTSSGNKVVGNVIGMSPTGTLAAPTRGVQIAGLEDVDTGYEITGNTIVGAYNEAITVSGVGSGVLIDGNYIGETGTGTVVPNNYGIRVGTTASPQVSGNLITGSTTAGIDLVDGASLAIGSTGNCVVGNAVGASSSALSTPDFENNWWGSKDGPSGVGSGSGDPVGGNVGFTPWLTNPPAMCNTAPVAHDATFTINAGASIGTLVGIATATDDGADLTFAITAGDPGGVFGVDPETGEVVILGTPDYPTTTSYSVTMEVTDTSSLSDTATITIDLTNQAPVATDAAFTIAENAAIGATVGTVVATDGDHDSLDWSIASGDPGSVFAIDGDGRITVAGSLDYETTPSYSLTVEAGDGFASDTAAVSVTVTDFFETPTTPTFGDVPTTHTFFADIEWLAAEGITRGCNPPANDLFCPGNTVTRGQMAAFLHRALGDVIMEGQPVVFTDAGRVGVCRRHPMAGQHRDHQGLQPACERYVLPRRGSDARADGGLPGTRSRLHRRWGRQPVHRR